MKREFLIMKGLAARLNQFFKENRRIQIQEISINENKLLICYKEEEKKSWKRWKRIKRFKRRYLAVNLNGVWKTGEEYTLGKRIRMKNLKEFQSNNRKIHIAIYEILD